jgi:hypothetical protein
MSALPSYKVIVAFDRQRVGDVIQPTGLLRDRLLRLKFIEKVDPPRAALTLPRQSRRERHA